MTPPRILGTLRRGPDGLGVVRVEDVYDTSPGDLWSALTEPARLARWVAVVSGDLRRREKLRSAVHQWMERAWSCRRL